MGWGWLFGLWSLIVTFCIETKAETSYLCTERKRLGIYFRDSHFRRNMIFDLIILKIYVDKRLRVQ